MRRRPRRRGQALIEFAIVLPVVILTFYAIFDVSRLMFVQLSLDTSAQMAARLLGQNHPSTRRGDVYRVVTSSAPGVRVPNNALRFQHLKGPDGGDFVEVELTAAYELLSAFYISRHNRMVLTAKARVPLATEAYGGRVHLP